MAARKRSMSQMWSDWFSKELRRDYHYEYINEAEGLYIKILRGRYKNVIFTYDNITVDDPTGAVSFEALIVDGNRNFTFEKKFSKIAEEIFVNTLEESMNNYKMVRKEILHDEEDRADYIEEPVDERIVRKKSSSSSSERVPAGKTRKDSL